ncbi:MAG: FAD-binding protein, partial [Firmicutes bacterium]|nr:FAD-binding protein [Bacillota bacterium]
MKKVSADIAIIGSGLAGLSAAINAKESAPELEVVVCSKSKPGLANCTAVSQGFFRNSNPSYPPERHEKETIKSGYGLNN